MIKNDIEAIFEWNRALQKWVSNKATQKDIGWLIEHIFQLVGCQKVQLLYFPSEGHPTVVTDKTSPGFGNRKLNPVYLSSTYLLDPFFRTAGRKQNGLYCLSDVAPEDFKKSEYYNSYYKRKSIANEVCITLSHSDTIILLSLVCFEGEDDFRSTDLQFLRACCPMIFEIIAKWIDLIKKSDQPSEANNVRLQMKSALLHFATSYVTAREKEVIDLMLCGHTIKSISNELGISEHTIKHHRTHIYSKLQIRSLSELFDLFIRSIKNYQPELSPDPLYSILQQSP